MRRVFVKPMVLAVAAGLSWGALPAVAMPPELPAAAVAGPAEGWIWHKVPFAADAVKYFGDYTDAALVELAEGVFRAIVVDDVRVETAQPHDLSNWVRVAVALQLLESRGKLEARLMPLARRVAFHGHALAVAAAKEPGLQEHFRALTAAGMGDAREAGAVAAASIGRLKVFSAAWFSRLAGVEPKEAGDHIREGRFALDSGRPEAAVPAFLAAWELAPTGPVALQAQRAMLLAGAPEATIAAFETRAGERDAKLKQSFENQRKHVAAQAANAAYLQTRPELDAAGSVERITLLVGHGHTQEAENLIATARARFPTDAPVWRVAAGVFHARGNRESLRLLYLDAAERGLMADDGLRELRLTALVDAATEAVRGGPTSLGALAPFEDELAWLEGRSRAHALLATTARTIPMLARAVTLRGTPEAASSEAAMRAHIDDLLSRFKDMPDAWRLALAGLAALRALETESGALLKRLATAPATVRPVVEPWIRLADVAYALRARKAGPIKATTQALERLAGKARGTALPPSADILRGASGLMQRSLSGKAPTAAELETARKFFEAARAAADVTTAAGRLEQQSAMVGLATIETVAGRTDAAIAAWNAVRAQNEYPYLNGIAAGWSLLLQGPAQAMNAAEFFLRAGHAAASPHEGNYAFLMGARAAGAAGAADTAAAFTERAQAFAKDAGLAPEVVPASGMRVVFVSGMQISLSAAWNEPLFANIAVDPVVALLPSP